MPYILCMLMPQITPFPTLTLVHMWYEKPTPWGMAIQPISTISIHV